MFTYENLKLLDIFIIMQSETQYRMNLTITMIRRFFGINLLILLTLSTLSAKPQPENLEKIKNELGGGVNLSVLEHYWTPTNELYNQDFHAKLKRIAKAGFKTVRLPVAPTQRPTRSI